MNFTSADRIGGIGGYIGGISALLGGNLLGGLGNNTSDMVSKESATLMLENAVLKSDLNTEKKMVEVFNALNDKINTVRMEQSAINAAQAVSNSGFTTAIAVANNNIAQLMGLTKLVIPNSSTCPGWGNVTITPATAAATTT